MRSKKKRGKKKATTSPSSGDVLDSAAQPASQSATDPLPAMPSDFSCRQPTTGSISAQQPSSSLSALSSTNQPASQPCQESGIGSSSADTFVDGHVTTEDSQQQAVLANDSHQIAHDAQQQALVDSGNHKKARDFQQRPAMLNHGSEARSSSTAASAQTSTAHFAEASTETANLVSASEAQYASTTPQSVQEAVQTSNVCAESVHDHLDAAVSAQQQAPAEGAADKSSVGSGCQYQPAYSDRTYFESSRSESQPESGAVHAHEMLPTVNHDGHGQLGHITGYPPAAAQDWQVRSGSARAPFSV